MGLPEIYLDNQCVNPDIPESLPLVCYVSLLDRALIGDNRRITGAVAEEKGVFNPHDFSRPLSTYTSLRLISDIIPARPSKVVVTLAIGSKYNQMLTISRPLMMEYAMSISADFVVIDKITVGMSPLHFEKWQIYDLLFKYDRLVFFDADMLISPDCPDLTTLVPRDNVGGYVEDDVESHSKMIILTQRQLGDIGWRKTYLNAGMGVYSWLHRPVFMPADRYAEGPQGDQNMYNYRIQLDRFPVFALPNIFNFMDLCGNNRYGAYIWHYAGKGFAGIKYPEQCFAAKLEFMRKDAKIIRDIAINSNRAPNARTPVFIPYFPRRLTTEFNCLDTFSIDYEGPGRFMMDNQKQRTALKDYTFMPLMIGRDCPMGDAIMALPVAREIGMRLFLPRTFAGNLVASLVDGIKIIREWHPDMLVYPVVQILLGNRDLLLSVDNWGTKMAIGQYGEMNATMYIAAAMGVSLSDAVPRLRRVAEARKKRVLIFPRGSVARRSLCSEFVDGLTVFLTERGYDVVSGDRRFEDPTAFAEFVASAEYVIGPFTGPIHLAAAMGVKTVALCVGDSPHAYRPLQHNARVLYSGCQRCWLENKVVDRRVCGEEFSFCQRAHSPRSVMIALRMLDAARVG